MLVRRPDGHRRPVRDRVACWQAILQCRRPSRRSTPYSVRFYGPDGDAPPVIVLGSMESASGAARRSPRCRPGSCVNVVGLVTPGQRAEAELQLSRATASRSGRAQEPEGHARDHRRDPGDHRGPRGAVNGRLQAIIDDLPLTRRGPEGRLARPAALHRCRDVHPGSRLPSVRGAPRARECGQLPGQAGRGPRLAAAVLLVACSARCSSPSPRRIKVTSRGPVFFVDERVGVGQQSVPLLQVPHHGPGRQGVAGRPGGAERSGRRPVQAAGRSRA